MAHISRYEPWNVLSQLQGELDRAFGSRLVNGNAHTSASDWVPSVDIQEEKDRFVIHADVPGVAPEAIHVSMDKGTLSISGERKQASTSEQNRVKITERVHGTFLRRFSLPEGVNADAISAKTTQGVLEIVIPKTEKTPSRTIPVTG